MKNILLVLFLTIPLFSFISNDSNPKDGQFRKDYNNVAIYDFEKEKWGDWLRAEHTFVLNYNSRNDVLHVKANGENLIYKKIGDLKEGYNTNGDRYQSFQALDEDGIRFSFLLYDDSEIGVMMIYSNIKIQFAYF